jgi:predicted MFS family arabinose efflux permease
VSAPDRVRGPGGDIGPSGLAQGPGGDPGPSGSAQGPGGDPGPSRSARGPGRDVGRSGSVRGRGFRLLWAGEASSRLGSSMTSVALPLVAVVQLEASAFQSALLYATSWLPWLLIGLPAGAWVDRLPKRRLMIACDLLAAALFASVPVAAWLDALTIGHLLAVSFAGGAVGVFFQTAQEAYLPILLGPEELARANARLHGTAAGAQVAGPGLAGLLAQLAGAVTAVLIDAVSFLVSALCLTGIRRAEPPARHDRAPIRREIGAGIRFVARDPYLRVLTLYGAASNVGLIGYQSLLVVFLVREVGLGAGTVGVLLAAISCGGVAGAACATPLARRIGSARAMLVCEGASVPFGLLIPLTGPGAGLAPLVVGGLVIGVGVVAGNVLKGAFRQQYTPPAMLGRTVVTMQFLNLGAIPLGAVAAGSLAAALGVRPALWCMTAGLALTGLILLIGPMRSRRDLPSQPDTGGAARQRDSAPDGDGTQPAEPVVPHA